MAAIPEKYLEQLRAAGLLTSEPFVSGHVAYPDGVTVAKPSSVAGHSLPNYDGGWGETDIKINAPALWFHYDRGRWFVTSLDYVPGPGPGDFVNQWTSPEEAVSDILDFYFGSSVRMDTKRLARND
jgi:hypothetical protein